MWKPSAWHMSHRTWPPSDNCFKGASILRITILSPSEFQKPPVQTESFIPTSVLEYAQLNLFAAILYFASYYQICINLFRAEARFSKVYVLYLSHRLQLTMPILYSTDCYFQFTLVQCDSYVSQLIASVSCLQLLLAVHRMLAGMLLTLKAFSSNGVHHHFNIRMD